MADNAVYYGPKIDRIDPIYYRKCTVFTTFAVCFRRISDAVLIDLGVFIVAGTIFVIMFICYCILKLMEWSQGLRFGSPRMPVRFEKPSNISIGQESNEGQ